MTTNANHDDATEVRLLLPWAATGRLSLAEMERVDALLKTSREAQAELEWWRIVSRDMRVESAAMQDAMSGDLGLAQFKARLPNTPQTVPKKAAFWRRWSLGQLLRPNWLAPALALSLCVVVVQGLVIEGTFGPDQNTMVPLGGASVADGANLSLSFQPQATETQIRAVLGLVQGEIVGGPSALGRYRVRVTGDVAQARARLNAENGVISEVEMLR